MCSQEQSKGFVLVTGATGGIGSEVCRALARKGYAPVVGYRSDSGAAEDLASQTGGVTQRLDLGDPRQIDEAIARLAGLPGQVAGLAHCASPPPVVAVFGRISEEDMTAFWRQNVVGPHRLLAGLVKQCLRKSRKGTIVAVASGGMGRDLHGAMPGLGAYLISKFGLCGVLALLAAEYSWLKVNVVSPGFTDTKMLGAFDERLISQLTRDTPLQLPAEVAEEIASFFE